MNSNRKIGQQYPHLLRMAQQHARGQRDFKRILADPELRENPERTPDVADWFWVYVSAILRRFGGFEELEDKLAATLEREQFEAGFNLAGNGLVDLARYQPEWRPAVQALLRALRRLLDARMHLDRLLADPDATLPDGFDLAAVVAELDRRRAAEPADTRRGLRLLWLRTKLTAEPPDPEGRS